MFNKEIIQNLMDSKGWTKYRLAKEAGLGQSTVHEIMSGKKKSPNAKTLQKLATALGVTVDTFFNDDSSPNESKANKERDYSLTIKEQENIDKEAQKILDDMTLSFSKNKDILTEEDYFAIEMALKSSLEAIKIKNKKKFTPKKYK
ncbi:helix-turn-helix domain-containing protein [Clostridium perfringens]|uniref:Helix-turn-helix transcriptional regulator n=2 Tax=Clostridium perfringens TaxID=1502 RepID=A0AAW4J4H3_CLOPF|nr:helix-turn-helix domain-containing protein [Clostridium perfringens]YP_008058954.1 helix-turn-helix domain-containing protein [Clostridium phage vB_CpeS-CP51]AGH27922.1 putative helix-turn-helix domain protein [Clostridium phage vB_CpeS-CP51]EDT14102.1 helix-turn-helix domain protein [Clostridium perfringens E str. JGS1987]EGT3618369.1 helix-turn-helix transcriptional regulator [Clostridium perfringens]EJT6501955.1 helix-turn-helix transcriptional regulator [Clostridium perfringens]ELC8398